MEVEIQKAKENAKKTDEASKFIVTGPSQSGDKYHAQNAASLAQSYVNRLEELKLEISSAKDGVSQVAEPESFIEIEYEDKSTLEFYLVDNAVSLTRFLFISKDSPLGLALIGKKVGDSFSYELEENSSKRKFSGKILLIE
ncbi:hypothetical protein A3F01_02875 [Candidatus Woesebacteria bacterium RIFCSPHIGHO2_12_FULL_38_11]|nr:MAG: hypothetical protein A3F01_02875 [Candidatus Woesebacteria bacterium RIFCSPHIGHO2_12_FULL_38_11]